MDVGRDWLAELEDMDEPEEEMEYWEDEELTPEELAQWSDMDAAEDARGMGQRLEGESSEPGPRWQTEGSLPDLIAAVLSASGDPTLMTDADLVNSLAGWHAIASRAVGRELRATEELLRRRKPRVWDRRADRAESRREELDGVIPGGPSAPDGVEVPERPMPAVVPSREAAAEISLALTATEYSAQVQAELAAVLSQRLPAAFCELDAGRADLSRVRVLAEATQFLSDEDAGKVDSQIAPLMGRMTTGELRDKARKAVIKVDQKAADRRRERAERKARFVLYGNEDQTATAAVERIPAHLGAAVKARVNAIARAARAAGMTDPMPLLEAKVATGLLLDTLPDIPPPADDDPPDGPPSGSPRNPGPAGDPWDAGWPDDWFNGPDATFGGNDPADSDTSGPGPAGPEPEPGPDRPGPGAVVTNFAAEPSGLGDSGVEEAGGAMMWPRIPVQTGSAAPGCMGVPAWLRPNDPGRIRLIAPWRTLIGIGPEPGELTWIGPITAAQARELAVAAADDSSCTWRLIVTDDEGRAVAITTLCTRQSGGPGPPGLVSEVTITISEAMAAAFGREGQSSAWVARALDRNGRLADLLAKAVPAANLAAAEASARAAADQGAGGCAHTMEAPGYRVPDRLRRWLNTRDRTCRNPVCRQPATRCDQDHTIAYHRGGRTCSCNLGGLCRAHHELKQLPSWQLAQDDQGNFIWRTPAGLTYRKELHRYAV